MNPAVDLLPLLGGKEPGPSSSSPKRLVREEHLALYGAVPLSQNESCADRPERGIHRSPAGRPSMRVRLSGGLFSGKKPGGVTRRCPAVFNNEEVGKNTRQGGFPPS